MSFKVCLLNIAYNIVLYKIVAVSAITGGQPAEQYPFFVSVYTENQLCGGTIVFDDIVVTAAHCLYDSHEQRWVYPHKIEIFHGDFTNVNDWNLTIYPCVDYITHFKFKPISHGCKSPYNVAVIKPGRTIEYYERQKIGLKLCFKSKNSHNGRFRFGTAVGLGSTSQRLHTQSEQLMEAVMELNENCGNYNSEIFRVIRDFHICYGDGSNSTCFGDSGGPLVYKEGSRIICLLGISTFQMEQCNGPQYPSIFGSVREMQRWILRRVQNFSEQSS